MVIGAYQTPHRRQHTITDVKDINNRFGSKEWANDLLRFCIKTLEGQIEVSNMKNRIATVLYVRQMLLEEGFWWQAKIINFWVHRARRGDFEDLQRASVSERADLSQRERGDS